MITLPRLCSMAFTACAALGIQSAALAQAKLGHARRIPPTTSTPKHPAVCRQDRQGSGGKLTITVHPAARCSRANEIKRGAGRAGAGRLTADLQPGQRRSDLRDRHRTGLATSFADSARAVESLTGPQFEARLARKWSQLLYSVPWPQSSTPRLRWPRWPTSGVKIRSCQPHRGAHDRTRPGCPSR